MRRFSLPSGTSDLTARPWDGFETMPGWVELAQVSVIADPAGFWHCMQQWTHERHWNRTIWKMKVVSTGLMSDSVTGSELKIDSVGLSTNSDCDSVNESTEEFAGPPPAGYRWIGIRDLYRKSPAPVGGGHDGKSPSYVVSEWTAQYVEKSTQKHVAVFGLCIPDNARSSDNPRALTYWPFQYPKVRALAVSYEAQTPDCEMKASDSTIGRPGILRYRVLPLPQNLCSGRSFEATRVHAANSALRLLTQCRKRAERFDSSSGTSTYRKRVEHDSFVEEERYRYHYDRLKERYGLYWAANWPESTDPVKFVYEELAIAAYMIALMEKERPLQGHKQSFVDLGCGNGFLTYLLVEEGHPGKGIDVQKRGIWDIYPDHVSRSLLQAAIDPEQFTCEDVDWIIGNHSDELTPWIPAIAARSQKIADFHSGPIPPEAVRPKFFVLPCCFYDFDGRKYSFGTMRRTLAVKDNGEGKYEQYLKYIARIAAAFGFSREGVVERENLRIPSTKNIALLGRNVQFPERMTPDVITETVRIAMWDARMSRR